MSNVPRILYPKDDFRIVVRDVLRVGDDLNAQFKKQAALYGRVSHFSARAKRQVRDLKNELEIVTARIRRGVSNSSGSRITKDEMQAILIRKKVYRKKLKQLDDAVYHEDVISGLLRALEHKKDSLIQLGAAARHEVPDEMRMLSRELKRRRNAE